MSQQYGRNTAYYNQRPHGLNVNNPGYTTYRDVSNVNRRIEASSPMIFRDSRQGNQERVSQFGYQQDYNKTSSSARKGLPFNNTSRLDFEAEFGLQGGRGHDGIGYQDDRIQNILLDEICSDFGIKDSIDLDLYNLDSVYPSTRLSDDLEELDQTIPFGKFDAEAELGGSLMPPPSVPNRMRCQQINTSGLVKGYQSKNGPPLTQGFIEKIEAVASPTISSSCEGGTSLTAVSGTPVVVKPQPPDSTSGDCVEEELTKGVSGEPICGEKLSNDKVKCKKTEESGNTNNYSSHVKLENCIPESQPVQASGGRNVNMSGELNSKLVSQVPSSMPASRRLPSCGIPNFSASPSARSSYQNTVQGGSAVNRCPPTTVGSDGSVGFRGGMVAMPVSEEVNAGESGATSCSTSTSVSPSQMHVAKKIRTINTGSDLLEEVRECFAYVHGADLFAPTSHSSFNDPSVDAFKPQYDGQKNMNFGGSANFTGGREYIQHPLQQMQQPGPGGYPQGDDGFSDTPTRRTIAPKSYVGDQFRGMERSRGGGGGGYGAAVSFNVSSPSVGSMGYQSCPDLTSPARQVQPFSPGVQSSPYQSRPYSPAGINRASQQYDMGTIPLANQQQQQPMMENTRNPTMNQRSNNSQGYAQVMPSSVKQDGNIGFDVSRNSPRPAHFPQKAMPQSPASFQMHQSQTQSAPCTPSKQKWDSMYHQSGAMQAEAYRGSPSSSGMTMSHGGAQQMMYPRESMGGASMHNPSLGRMQENQYTMNNNNVCPTPGKTMGNESMDRINRSGMMGRNDLVSGSYNSPSQDGRSRDDPRYSNYSPGVNMNNYRRGTNYPVVPERPAGREMYRNNSNMAPVNATSHHSSRAPQNYGAFVNTGAPAHDLPLSQHGFLRRLIGEDSGAFSAHPLYPLLRDLIIADMNFHTPSFPFPLIANLPCEFEKLLDNYRSRNPGLVLDHADPTVQMVVIDAVKYAHSALIETALYLNVMRVFTFKYGTVSLIEVLPSGMKVWIDESPRALCKVDMFCENPEREWPT